MKDIRFGSIPENYKSKDGKDQTAWVPTGYKAVIDWEERSLFIVDSRTGKQIFFFQKTEKPVKPQSTELQPDNEVPW